MDSIDSEISEEEKINIFKNINIIRIIKIQSPLDKIIETFNQRYHNKIEYISDISINASFYYPNNKNDKLNLKDIYTNYKNFDLNYFIKTKKSNILYSTGPKGTSKSLFLMFFSYMINKESKVPLLYINHRKMKDLSPNEKKKYF